MRKSSVTMASWNDATMIQVPLEAGRGKEMGSHIKASEGM